MDKNTISHYGWIIVLSLVVSIMLVLATPFGKYIMDGVTSAAKGFIDSSKEAFGDEHQQGIVDRWEEEFVDNEPTQTDPDNNNPESSESCSHINTRKEGETKLYTGDVFCIDCGKLIQLGNNVSSEGGIIPSGGIYKQGEKTYQAGELFPIIQDRDEYVYGDIQYIYSKDYGWYARANDKTLSNYGELLWKINGKPLVSLHRAFEDCINLTTFPKIPKTVEDMSYAFNGCTALSYIPHDLIGENVTDITGLLNGCIYAYNAMNDALIIPASITGISDAFNGTEERIYIASYDNNASNKAQVNIMTEQPNIVLVAHKTDINSNTAFIGQDITYYSPGYEFTGEQVANSGWSCYKFIPTKTGQYNISSAYGTYGLFYDHWCDMEPDNVGQKLLQNISDETRKILEENGAYDSYGIILTKSDGKWNIVDYDDDAGGDGDFVIHESLSHVELKYECDCGENIYGYMEQCGYTFSMYPTLQANQEYYIYIMPYSSLYSLNYHDYVAIRYCN